MVKTTKKYSKPGKWKVVILFEKRGEEKEWVGIIDARLRGEYELVVVADHQARGTRGRVTVKAVVGRNARVKIRGVIKIAKEAQETENFLEMRGLMLSSTSQVMAEPELEIKANNVKASHAASAGPVAAEQILYLRSRGLSDEEAMDKIITGWLGV
jgi:Fe-S cluster assembly protein SufD